MRYYFSRVSGVLCLFSLILLFSCKGIPPAQKPETPPVKPVRPERPKTPEEIMGQGLVAQDKLASFLMSANTEADPDYVKALAGYYIDEAAAEGVNHDVAFAQMCLETGSLLYGGLVTPDMNNFCGLGSTGAPGPDGPERGNVFPDPRTGVRAHIQHLKAYATKEPLNQELVDPRYRYVKLGISPTIHGLTGRWAADRYYAVKVTAILDQLYDYSF
jgi:hypothetical protein